MSEAELTKRLQEQIQRTVFDALRQHLKTTKAMIEQALCKLKSSECSIEQAVDDVTAIRSNVSNALALHGLTRMIEQKCNRDDSVESWKSYEAHLPAMINESLDWECSSALLSVEIEEYGRLGDNQ